MANETYLHNVDTEKVATLMQETDTNVKYFNDTTQQVADAYTKDLDALMLNLRQIIMNSDDVPTETIEKYFLELSNMVYFIGSNLEQVGVYSDMAKSAAKEVYNKAYLANQVKDIDKKNKTTVAENQAVAEQTSQYEAVVGSVYDHAYKIVKYKIDAATTMIATLSKIITKRINENTVSSYAPKKY